MQTHRFILGFLVAALSAPLALSQDAAESTENKQRETEVRLHGRFAPAVVGLELTIAGQQSSAPANAAEQQEIISQGVGTVVSPDGLVVTSLASLDFLRLGVDSRAEATMLAARSAARSSGRQVISGRLESADVLKGAKIRRADGQWIPATILLKDPVLDLVFLAPATSDPSYKYPFVDPAKAAAYQWHGKYYVPFRNGKDADWVSSLTGLRPDAELKSPRRYYLVLSNNPGCPVIDDQGQMLGLIVYRPIDDKPRIGKTAILALDELQPLVAQARTARTTPSGN